MTELTKTLELKLVDPNAHKRKKLRETREAYQRALQDAFDARCTTQSFGDDLWNQIDDVFTGSPAKSWSTLSQSRTPCLFWKT